MKKDDIKHEMKKDETKHRMLEDAVVASVAACALHRVGKVLTPVILLGASCLGLGAKYVYKTVRNYPVNSAAKTEWYYEHAGADVVSASVLSNDFYAAYKPTPEMIERLEYVRNNKDACYREIEIMRAEYESIINQATEEFVDAAKRADVDGMLQAKAKGAAFNGVYTGGMNISTSNIRCVFNEAEVIKMLSKSENIEGREDAIRRFKELTKENCGLCDIENQHLQDLVWRINDLGACLEFADVDPSNLVYEANLVREGRGNWILSKDEMKEILAERKGNPEEAQKRRQDIQKNVLSFANYCIQEK